MKVFVTKATLIFMVSLTAVFFAGAAMASDKDWHEKEGHGYSCDKKHKGHSHKDSHSWKKTLSDEQKAEIDNLKLSLKKELSSIEAKIELKKTEANNLITSDNPEKAAIGRLANEISMLKKEAIQLRYDNMIKVRSLLKPEQKAMFDKEVLSRRERYKGHS